MSNKPTKLQHAPTEVVKVQDLPHFTVETACLNCKADMRGEWFGAEPQRHTLECFACGQLHIVDIGEKHESKPTSSSKPQRPPTKDELELALSRLGALRPHLVLPNRDDDDPFEVMRSVIEELLHKRESIAAIQGFMQQWLAENVRR